MRNNLGIEELKLTYENLGKRMHELHESLKMVERGFDPSLRSDEIINIRRSISDCVTARIAIDELLTSESAPNDTPKNTTASEKRIKQHEAQGVLISENELGVKYANEVKVPDGVSLLYIGDNKYKAEFDSSKFLAVSDFLNEVGVRRREVNVTLYGIRDAIQAAEKFGLVRDEAGNVITGAVMTEHGIMLTKE